MKVMEIDGLIGDIERDTEYHVAQSSLSLSRLNMPLDLYQDLRYRIMEPAWFSQRRADGVSNLVLDPEEK